jgi:ATP-dependent DNA helicase RecG
LPREVVAEAIVNAVVYRDYTSNASVQVMLFADRLGIWNPGELPPSLTINDLRIPHASIPRNPMIAEPMFLARYVEKAGTGILDMIARCREAGLPAPEFRQSGGGRQDRCVRGRSGPRRCACGAEEQVDDIRSKGDPAALLSACNAWVAAWHDEIEAWKKLNLSRTRISADFNSALSAFYV